MQLRVLSNPRRISCCPSSGDAHTSNNPLPDVWGANGRRSNPDLVGGLRRFARAYYSHYRHFIHTFFLGPNVDIDGPIGFSSDIDIDRPEQGKPPKGDALEGILYNKGEPTKGVWVAISIPIFRSGEYEPLQFPYIRPSVGIVSYGPFILPEMGKEARRPFWLAFKRANDQIWYLATPNLHPLEKGQVYEGKIQVCEGEKGKRKIRRIIISVQNGVPAVVLSKD